MITKRTVVQFFLMTIGILLVISTYFFYPAIKEKRLLVETNKEKINLQEEIKELEVKEQTLIDQIQEAKERLSSEGVLKKDTLENLQIDLQKTSASLFEKRSTVELFEKRSTVEKEVDIAKTDITTEGDTFESVTYQGENAGNPFTLYADKAEIKGDVNIIHMKNMLITIFLRDSEWEVECEVGTYNKLNYNIFCSQSVKASDGKIKVYSQKLDLINDESAKIYNNVVIIDENKSNLYADRVDYDFENKLYHINMFDKDERVKIKLIE